MKTLARLALLAAPTLSASPALADDAPAEAPAAAPAAAASQPRPYSLPWQLRPAAAATVVRSDTAIASYQDAAGNAGSTVVTLLAASYKVTPELAPIVRVGWVRNSPPTGDAGTALTNPLLGATWAPKLGGDLRLALYLATTLPVGQGGGDTPDKATAAAVKSGVLARSAMDNVMFAVNDATIVTGADLAWVSSGFTVQVEATVVHARRVRGADVQPDESKTNLTTGLHVGYFALPELSIGAELRHQRWLSTPAAVEADGTGSLRDTTTFAVGPRAHLHLSGSTWFRPGVAYARGIDDPMSAAKYDIVQIDLPVSF